MKRLAFLGIFVASFAWAVSYIDQDTKVKTEKPFTISNTIAQNATILADSGFNGGIDLARGGGVMATVCVPDGGFSIIGGTMRAYVWQPIKEIGTSGAATNIEYMWVPYPSLDWTPSTLSQCAVSGDKQSFSGVGRITWLPDAMLTDAGGTILLETLTVRKGLPMGLRGN